MGNGLPAPLWALAVSAVKPDAVTLVTMTISCAAPVSMSSAAPG